MGEIDDKIKKLFKEHKVVGLDTMLFIYSMEAKKPYMFLAKVDFLLHRKWAC